MPTRSIIRVDDADTAQLTVAGQRLEGAILASDRDSLTVYGGPVIPEEIQSTRPQTIGWRWATDSSGQPVASPVRQVAVTLIDLTNEARPRFWRRLIWTTALPRPMQRMDVALGSTQVMQVRTLVPVAMGSADGRSHGAMIASTTGAGTPDQLRAAGWFDASDDPWPDRRVWGPLHQLSEAMETHTAALFGRAYVANVTVSGEPIDPVVAQTLPNDVLDALIDALDHAA